MILISWLSTLDFYALFEVFPSELSENGSNIKVTNASFKSAALKWRSFAADTVIYK